MALRVVLADDHVVLRQGVRALLERHGIDVVAEAADGRAAVADEGSRLTSRERQVVQLVAEGKSTKQVAALLAITPKTAEFHRARVMKKLDVHDVAGLVRYAIREGLITP